MTSPCNNEEEIPNLLPVGRLHNYLYCPRLFYLRWVENLFVLNEDMALGSSVHHRVDEPNRLKQEALQCETGSLRSIALSSETLGISGVADLLEEDEQGRRKLVDYKKGYPQRDESGEWKAKENDAVQLAAYALLLKEQGVHVSSASVYYAAIKRHVDVPLDDELFDLCVQSVKDAKNLAAADT